MNTEWMPYPYTDVCIFDAARVQHHWQRLHAGDAEPCPTDPALLGAWALFHGGEFQKAAEAGLAIGGVGITIANKATAIYAHHLEPSERVRHELFRQVAERAGELAVREPRNANAWYWQAHALSRYSHGLGVAKSLAQGVHGKIRLALENTIELAPTHADAHIELGSYHAEMIDKVGSLIGGMTHGVRREDSLRLLRRGLELHPASPYALVEYANALVMLDGESMAHEATRLYQQAASQAPLDAAERLVVELARAELHEAA